MTLDDTKLNVTILKRYHRMEWRYVGVALLRALPSILFWIGLVVWLRS